MALSHFSLRSTLLLCVLAAAPAALTTAAEPARVVFQNGKSIPITSLALQADKLVIQNEVEGFTVGQSLPLASADHVYGVKPPAMNQAVAQLSMGKARVAQKLLDPVIAEHRLTAKIPGNFWLEAARTMLVAYAVNGNAKECEEIGKEISDATPAAGNDPFVTLGKALLLPVTVKVAEREAALRDLTSALTNMPADVCAFATFYRGNLYRNDKRAPEALNAYLEVSCLYPSGNLVLMACAEIQAADLLTALSRREEAAALLRYAVRDADGTLLVEEANKRLESLK